MHACCCCCWLTASYATTTTIPYQEIDGLNFLAMEIGEKGGSDCLPSEAVGGSDFVATTLTHRRLLPTYLRITFLFDVLC